MGGVGPSLDGQHANVSYLEPMNSTGGPSFSRSRGLYIPPNLGRTAEGSFWAMRALHPCDEAAGGSASIPNLSATESANLEVRHANILSYPFTVDTDHPAVNWDVQFCVLPYADMAVAYRTKKSNATEWGFWLQYTPAQGNVLTGVSTLGTSSALFDPGTAPTLSNETTQFRQAFRGATFVLNTASLTNQGLVTAGQWGQKVDTEEMYPVRGVDDTSGLRTASHLVLTDIPTSPDDIVIKCPTAGQWEARKGVYLPMRFNDTVHIYTDSVANMWQNTNENTQIPYGGIVSLRDKTSDNTPSAYVKSLVFL